MTQTGYESIDSGRGLGMQSRGFRITLVGRPQDGPCHLKKNQTNLSKTAKARTL